MIGAEDILHGKILIVDDQLANVTLLERMLSGAGYTMCGQRLIPETLKTHLT